MLRVRDQVPESASCNRVISGLAVGGAELVLPLAESARAKAIENALDIVLSGDRIISPRHASEGLQFRSSRTRTWDLTPRVDGNG